MPYYVHTKTCAFIELERTDDDIYPAVKWIERLPSETMKDFDYVDVENEPTADYHRQHTAKDAHAAKTALRTEVTFAPTEHERSQWRRREKQRLAGTRTDQPRQNVPWTCESWYDSAPDGKPSLEYSHYAYLSIVHPGKVGYTPSEEYGVTDRQLLLRPGRYLEKFAPHLTQVERDEWCAKVKASLDANVVLFASTADAIERVYCHGPSSCMAHDAGTYASPFHPVRVYGDSDFDIAYLEHDGRVRARAIVWREKKLVGRCYGDTTLIHLLVRDGYTKVDEMTGARITAVRYGDRYSRVFVLPYMDVCTSVYFDGTNLITSEDDCDGHDYLDARGTNGLTDDSITNRSSCSNEGCDGDCDEDETYCSYCSEHHYCCESCQDDYFDDDSHYIRGYGTLCDHCYNENTQACERCTDTFTELAFSRTERRRRSHEDLTDYCEDCATVIEDERREKAEEDNDDTDDGINETEDERSPF